MRIASCQSVFFKVKFKVRNLTSVKIEKKNKQTKKDGNLNGKDVSMDGLPGKVCYVRVWPSGQQLELRISFKLLPKREPGNEVVKIILTLLLLSVKNIKGIKRATIKFINTSEFKI